MTPGDSTTQAVFAARAELMTLAECERGVDRVVASIAGADGVAARLFELGVLPGARVRLLGAAPLGDPLEIEVDGRRLSLRRAEAGRVLLTET